MTDLRTLIDGASTNSAVRQDLHRLNLNGGQLTKEIMDRARLLPGHATELSAALQRIEVRAGNEGNFGLQRGVDRFQQQYDQAAGAVGVRSFSSGDVDGIQRYEANPNLAASQRAAEHAPISRHNASQASAEIQRQQWGAAGRGDFASAARIDRLQKMYERDEGISGVGSQDPDRGVNQGQAIAAAIAFMFMLQARAR